MTSLADVAVSRLPAGYQPYQPTIQVGQWEVPDPGEIVDAVTGAAAGFPTPGDLIPGDDLNPIDDIAGNITGQLGKVVLGPVAEIAVIAVLGSAGAALIVWAVVRLTKSTDTGSAAIQGVTQGGLQAVGGAAMAAAG